MTGIRSYREALAYLGNKDRRPLAWSTDLHREGERVCVRYHETDVVTFTPDGSAVLDNGGFFTPTTKKRMNDHIPTGTIYQDKGAWYYTAGGWGDSDRFPFTSGMAVTKAGTVVYPDGFTPPDPKARQRLGRDIAKYAKAYSAALVNREIPTPSNGDCWSCLMGWRGLPDHLTTHMEESYFVPSLLVRAHEDFPMCDIAQDQLGRLWYGTAEDQAHVSQWGLDVLRRDAERAIRRHMRRALGLAS